MRYLLPIEEYVKHDDERLITSASAIKLR